MRGAKSFDETVQLLRVCFLVLIPDTWGKSSDKVEKMERQADLGLNPRYVGQVFRRSVGSIRTDRRAS